MVRRGQRAAGWLARPHPPLAPGQAAWVWRGVPSQRTGNFSLFKPPGIACDCGGLLCSPSLFSLWMGEQKTVSAKDARSSTTALQRSVSSAG